MSAPRRRPSFSRHSLRSKRWPFSLGRSIVATVEPYEHQVLTAIHDLGLEWHVIFNKGCGDGAAVGRDKGDGLTPALKELESPPTRLSGSATPKTTTRFSECAVWP